MGVIPASSTCLPEGRQAARRLDSDEFHLAKQRRRASTLCLHSSAGARNGCDWIAGFERNLVPALARHDIDTGRLDVPCSHHRPVGNIHDDVSVRIFPAIFDDSTLDDDPFGVVEHRKRMVGKGRKGQHENGADDCTGYDLEFHAVFSLQSNPKSESLSRVDFALAQERLRGGFSLFVRRVFKKSCAFFIAGVTIVIARPIAGSCTRIAKRVCVRLRENCWVCPRERDQQMSPVVLQPITLYQMGMWRSNASARNCSDAFIAETDRVYNQSIALPVADGIADCCVIE